MKLIVNADDFALSEATNHGIVKAFSEGIVRSTTLMANMSAVDHALQLSKTNPLLGIGIHMVLTAGKPLSSHCKTIVDEGGAASINSLPSSKNLRGGVSTQTKSIPSGRRKSKRRSP